MGGKGAFSYQEGNIAGGKAPYSAFGVKIRQGLRYSANGDENCRLCACSSEARIFLSLRNLHPPAPTAPLHPLRRRRPCTFCAGAPASIEEGLPAPAAPPLDPPLHSDLGWAVSGLRPMVRSFHDVPINSVFRPGYGPFESGGGRYFGMSG